MRAVTVDLPGRGYDIWIGDDILCAAAQKIAAWGHPHLAVVSDETVWRLHGEALRAALAEAGVAYSAAVVLPGEDSKSLAGLDRVYAHFAENGLGRDGLVAAFGGGVVGDLAGFAAATWMRGVPCVQIPTTLLAQVDSSVGGKTAINLPAGKNLVGAFHQPKFVAADTRLLQTLPPRELRCGMAEVVKYGAIFSRELLSELAEPPREHRLPAIIEVCCQMKRQTVQRDERDTGVRMLLNFGHSFGHAVEQLGGFSHYNHGEAVAIGMALAAAVGERAGVTPPRCGDQLRAVLEAQGLPAECPYTAKQLLPAMLRDKKSRGGGLDLILLTAAGEAKAVWFPPEQLEALLGEVL